MKNSFKICVLFVYFLFSQVYPFVHKHAGQDHYDLELNLFLQAPEISDCGHEHESHHPHAHEHAHHDAHFLGDWEYTFQMPVMFFSIETPIVICFETPLEETSVLIGKPQDIPLKLPRDYLTGILPDRAPPQFC